MIAFARRALPLAVVVAFGTFAVAASALTVKDIMGRLNKGRGALTTVLKKELLAGSPNWGEIQPQAHEYAELAGQLAGQQPPKGDHASWVRMSKDYADAAQALAAAADHKDKAAALAAHTRLAQSCNACHKAHRE